MNDSVIEIKNLSFGHGRRCVVQDFNAVIREGEYIGIIGCNGAGKSTFLKTLRGLLPKIGGTVCYSGLDMDSLPEREFAKRVAYLQQHVELGFGYTAKEIVLTGRYPYMKWWERESKEDEALALECMEYTGTADLADRPVNEVSGGQRQRIFLAKVLAQQTPILFLDEPTAGLDMVYQEEIFRFAKALSEKGKTILMVAHELNLAAKYCDRIFLLGEGKLLADGTPDEVFTEPLLSRAYAADVEIARNPENNNLEITTKLNIASREEEKRLLDRICGRCR